MNDLIKRLREISCIIMHNPVLGYWPYMRAEPDAEACSKAADEISRLTAERDALGEYMDALTNQHVAQTDELVRVERERNALQTQVSVVLARKVERAAEHEKEIDALKGQVAAMIACTQEVGKFVVGGKE